MPECDLHVHSIRSSCGFHTLLEIVDIMREKRQKAFALTDHSPIHETPVSHFSVMLKRMPPVIKGIRVFKGIETTILNYEGDIDLPEYPENPYEVILAGLHEYGEFTKGVPEERSTRAVINAMKRNPDVKIITHPFYSQLPVDLDAVTDIAAETGKALEINNSYLMTGKADTEAFAHMLEFACQKKNLLCINSDGHMFHEIGEYGLALKLIKPYGIEESAIVNRTFESTLAFLGLEG